MIDLAQLAAYDARVRELGARMQALRIAYDKATNIHDMERLQPEMERLVEARYELARGCPDELKVFVALRSFLGTVDRSIGVAGYLGRKRVTRWDEIEDIDLMREGLDAMLAAGAAREEPAHA